ncbi:hypothetical protein ACIQUU_32145 [Streptomyces sp. NPDC101116]|uniref:hypothetical protein n=1 Tax=Streptomyces sp. NPDC101116 TaxID=3366107 RepID=UPI0037F2870A
MPHVPQDVLDRLAALEREVRQLRGRAQMRPAMNQVLNGDVVIGEGGRLFVRDPDGTNVFETGQSATGDYFTRMRRDNGALALTIGANSYPDDDAPSQMVRMFSRAGDIIVMDDYHADRFLGRPWLPLQMHPTKRQAYTGTTYADAWIGTSPAMNAVARLSLQTWAGDGGAQVQVLLTYQGTTTVDEWDCPANQWTGRTIIYPLHAIPFMGSFTIGVQHRAKTNGQEVETRVYSAYTRNTFNEDEAPDPPLAAVATAPATEDAPAPDTAPSTGEEAPS